MATQFNDILKAMQGAIDDFNATIPASQRSMLNSIQVELKGLDLSSSGDIKTSVQNLKLVGKIKGQLQNLILTDKYLANVQDYVDKFLTISQLQNDYWTNIEATFKPAPLLEEIKKQAVNDTVNSLTEQGIGATITEEISSILQNNITSGGSYADLTDQLRTALTDQEGNPGLLSRYAKQITTDAINQYSAQYTKAVSDDLGYEWFAYQGSDIQTTRPFCDAMTDFTFFHVSEIPDLLEAKNLYYTNKKTGQRELVPIYQKTGLPNGMIPGTNPSNFQIQRGGYNCGHQIRPVSVRLVPPYIQTRSQVPGIMDKAKAAVGELDAIDSKYAERFGGTDTPVNFKGYESILRKSRDELGGDLSQLKDAVRSTVVVPYERLDEVAAALRADPTFTRVKIQQGPEYFGYKGIIANLRLKNGTIAEMQVNSPGMIYAKVAEKDALHVMTKAKYDQIAEASGLPGGLGHEYYDKIRVLTPGKITPAQAAERERLIAASVEYYSHFYGY